MNSMSADRRMIKMAMAAPYLERAEEHDLAVAWKDHEDRGARNKIATKVIVQPMLDVA